MDILFIVLIILLALILTGSIIKKIASKITVVVINSLIGLIGLQVINSQLGMGIPITLATLLIVGLFGVPGVATLILLRIINII